MTIRLDGIWKNGFAYDVHTLDSVYLGVDENGHDQWKTTRTEMGELVFRLKYRNDSSAVVTIVDLLAKYKGIETMDYIIPIPATNPRRLIQPVEAIARELGRRNGVPVLTDLLKKKQGSPPLKDVHDPQERQRLLAESMVLSNSVDVSNKNVLLVDDLYRSGETLTAAAKLLYEQGRVMNVYVLTMTKTRSKR